MGDRLETASKSSLLHPQSWELHPHLSTHPELQLGTS